MYSGAGGKNEGGTYVTEAVCVVVGEGVTTCVGVTPCDNVCDSERVGLGDCEGVSDADSGALADCDKDSDDESDTETLAE